MNNSIALPFQPITIPSTTQAATLNPSQDRVNPRIILAFIARRWPIILTAMLAVTAVGFAITIQKTPLYISTVEIIIDSSQEPIAPLTDVDRFSGQNTKNETYIDTQVEIITSSHNIAGVVDRLGLSNDPRFITNATNGAEARAAAIDYVASGVSAFRPNATYTIAISFESENPTESAEIANAFATQYTLGSLADKEAGDEKSLSDIGKRMEAARIQAATDAQLLAKYRITHNLPATLDRSLTEQEISSYNQQVTESRAQTAEDAARLATAQNQLKSGSNGDDVGEALGSAVVASLRQQQAAYATEVASLSSKYGSRHPEILRAQTQLDSTTLEINREISRIISNLAAKVEVSEQRLASLTGSLRTSQRALQKDNIAMVPLQDIEQRAQASKALYESYLSRYKDLSARIGIRQPEARILHPASVSDTPSSPNLILNMTLATAIGLALGLMLAIAVEVMFSGIPSGDQVEQRLGLRYLGSIPELSSVLPLRSDSLAPIDAIIEQPRSAFAEAFRNLRTSITLSVKNPKVIAITSALPSEGKTTTAICLSRSMAHSSDRILLIDCDSRKRSISQWIGGAHTVGILEVLRGEATLAEAIMYDSVNGLSVLPFSASINEDHALLTGPAMDALLAQASRIYDAIILDTPPVLAIADTRLLMCKADAVIIATRWQTTPETALRALLRMLPVDHVFLAGIVLTRLDVRKQSTMGSYEHSFYKSYKNYYV